MQQESPIKYAAPDKAASRQAQEYKTRLDAIRDAVYKQITGQRHAIDRMLIGVISDGHILVEGVPGLAKTLMIRTMARVLGADSVRIQFTPDLLPADIIGTKIYKSSTRSFETHRGPIFHSFVLADEINRAPPKVQSALLEAMQERQVSIHGDTHALGRPFMVLATQNPIEGEGTYRLPEAQIDRFAMKITMTYPTRSEEIEITGAAGLPDGSMSMGGGGHDNDVSSSKMTAVDAISSAGEICAIQTFCGKIYTDRLISEYVTDIVRATRDPSGYDIDLGVADGAVEYGASPRASIWLAQTARAMALLHGRGFVIPEDVKAMAHDVLRHRIILTFDAEAREITTDQIITRILEKINPP